MDPASRRLCGSLVSCVLCALCVLAVRSYGLVSNGGEGGIRTHDEFPRTRFPGERPRPLGDLSLNEYWICDFRCLVGGEGGIRTHEELSTLTRFRDELFQPL